MGFAAALTSRPNSVATAGGSPARDSHRPASSSASARNRSASGARRGVGAAEPMPVPAWRRSGCSARLNAATAMTIAFRVPILLNCCGSGRRA